MEDKYYSLIIEYFEKTISNEGLTQLREWIDLSAENLAQFTETIEILEASKAYFKQPEMMTASWAAIEQHIGQSTNEPEKKAPLKLLWLAYAAACLIFCGLGWLGYTQFFKISESDYNIFTTSEGKQKKIQLPDGSIVYLGGGSTLKYVKNFSGSERGIDLKGEAFFNVVHQVKRPFIVKSGTISTVVLGTSFNVNAYPRDKKVTIMVESGKVGVMANLHGKQQLVKYLVKNEQVQIDTKTGLYTSSTQDDGAASAWTRNELVFYNTRFSEIATAVEHQYGIKIEFTDPDMGKIKLTAKFKNKPLTEVMETLSLLSGLAYTQKGNHLFISNNDQKGGRIMK